MTLAKDVNKLLNSSEDTNRALEYALKDPLKNSVIISNLSQLQSDCSIAISQTGENKYAAGSFYMDLPFNNLAFMAETAVEVKNLVERFVAKHPELKEGPIYGLYDRQTLELIEANFRVTDKTKELQMVVNPEEVPEIDYDNEKYHLERLTVQDIVQISHLYSLVPAMAWTPKALTFGPYYGLYCDEHLVSIAGVHFQTRWTSEIGNIVTHFKHRRQNLAYVCTKAVIDNLKSHCDNIFLCVIADNHSAVKLYEKMGFVTSDELFLTQYYI
jgi:ribosomal protein S18 acetylase RimI-like enzyme